MNFNDIPLSSVNSIFNQHESPGILYTPEQIELPFSSKKASLLFLSNVQLLSHNLSSLFQT